MYSLAEITPPAVEPIDLQTAKRHLRVVAADEEADIVRAIAAARQEAETRTGRQLLEATWKLSLDKFPRGRDRLYLPRPQLRSITSVEFVDGSGQTQTLVEDEDFVVYEEHEPGFLVPSYGKVWPSTRDEPLAVRVTYKCGYGIAAEAVPDSIRSWILLRVGDQFNFREGHQPGSVTRIGTFEDGLLGNYIVGDEFWSYGERQAG